MSFIAPYSHNEIMQKRKEKINIWNFKIFAQLIDFLLFCVWQMDFNNSKKLKYIIFEILITEFSSLLK